jgi:hypothetical protein
MGPEHESLTMYGHPSELPPLAWNWVEAELAEAGSYWVTARDAGHPHPRPVWGVWGNRQLHLSIGSPVVSRLLEHDATVTVHLSSDVDVVIVEGHVSGFAEAPALYEAYNQKYDWDYTIEEYGPLTTVSPSKILAWRSAGWAGRDGFQYTGRWRLQDQPKGAAEAR